MSSHPPDPQAAIPELFPEDIWDDSCQMVKNPKGFDTVLPLRKVQVEEEPSSATSDQIGLRIGSSGKPDQAVEDPEDTALEVREIDGSVVRLEPEQPAQPRMPRQQAFHEKPEAPPRGLESSAWGEARKFPLKWVLGISVGIATVVIAALSLQPAVNRPNAIRADQQVALVLDEAGDELGELYAALISKAEEAVAVFTEFKTASTREKLLPLVRDRADVEPLILSTPHAVLISRHWDPQKDAQWEVKETQKRPFGLLRGRLPDHTPFEAYFVLADHQLLLDWKATTGYGTSSFEELKAGTGNPAEIRGVISPGEYFSPIFPESEYRSFLLDSPDGSHSIWCYSRRESSVADTLTGLCLGGAIVKRYSTSRKVTLRLERGPNEALPNQWLIGELLHDEWISP